MNFFAVMSQQVAKEIEAEFLLGYEQALFRYRTWCWFTRTNRSKDAPCRD